MADSHFVGWTDLVKPTYMRGWPTLEQELSMSRLGEAPALEANIFADADPEKSHSSDLNMDILKDF